MKTFNTVANFAAKILCVAFFSLFAIACSEEITNESRGYGFDKIETHDYTGYSIGDITNSEGRYTLGTRIDLGFKQIEVDENTLGHIDYVDATNPVVSDFSQNGMTGGQLVKDFSFFSDGQTAHGVGQWLVDSLAPYHYEVTNIAYIDYASEPIGDGRAYKVTPHFQVNYRQTLEGTTGILDLYPDYVHVLKGVEVNDSLIITTHNNEGYADGNVINVLGTGSSEINITLTKNNIPVAKSDLGTVTLVSATDPSSTDISTSAQKGMRYMRNFNFSDTQVATTIYQFLHQLSAENHVEITDVNYVDYQAIKTAGDKYAEITLHFRVAYQRYGNLTETGYFDLYPRYQQMAKDEQPVIRYEVDDSYKDKTLSTSKVKKLTVKITRYVNEVPDTVWTLTGNVSICGSIGGDNLYVSSATPLRKEYSDEDESNNPNYVYERVVNGNEKFREKSQSHVWKYKEIFQAHSGGEVYSNSEIRYQSVQYTFTDGDFTWSSQTFKLDTEITYDQIDIEPELKGTTKDESGCHFTYGGTLVQTVRNTLDGQDFFSSTAKSPLYVQDK
jgi:hypothetical protein